MVHRNRMLTTRYYYWMYLKRVNYMNILANLEKEFAISEQRIVRCINDEKETLDTLMDEKPNTAYLKKNYPWFDWS